MPRLVWAVTLGTLVALSVAAPRATAAESSTDAAAPGAAWGCASALAHAWGTPGAPFVRAACARATSGEPPAVTADAAAAEQGMRRGCARALAHAAGTPGEAHVRAACARAQAAVGAAVTADQTPEVTADQTPEVTSDDDAPSAIAGDPAAQATQQGCAGALVHTRGTPGAPFVRAACGQGG
jgi:hypothetical protein